MDLQWIILIQNGTRSSSLTHVVSQKLTSHGEPYYRSKAIICTLKNNNFLCSLYKESVLYLKVENERKYQKVDR